MNALRPRLRKWHEEGASEWHVKRRTSVKIPKPDLLRADFFVADVPNPDIRS